MTSFFPLTKLIKLNLLLAGVISLFVFVFLTMGSGSPLLILSFTLLSASIISSVSFMHILLMITFANKETIIPRTFNIHRYYLSFIYSIVIYLGLWPLFSWMGGLSWHVGDIKTLMILSIAAVLVNAVILIVQDYLILQHRNAKSDLENSELRVAHAHASNNLLKQQIHPHFLFNALNTMNTLYRKDLELGENYMMHLADFLRTSVNNHHRVSNSLAEELKFCQDYMVMQGIRFGSALIYNVDIPDKLLSAAELPSFSLQPLLENAIKHNEFTIGAPLSISVAEQDGYIVVSNNIKLKNTSIDSPSTGLTNLAQRVRLWSGEELKVVDDGRVFSVSLKLSYENRNH